MYACMHACMYVCMYLHIYIYTQSGRYAALDFVACAQQVHIGLINIIGVIRSTRVLYAVSAVLPL